MRTRATLADAEVAVAAWDLCGVRAAPLGDGLINDTFAVDSDTGGFVLQRVHPVFTPGVHDNIAAVTARLVERGIPTPVLLATREGGLCAELSDGVWRVMTRMPGLSFAAVGSPAQARNAAAILARFHGALADLPHGFVGMRVGVHDTPAHLAALAQAVSIHSGHRLHADVARLAAEIHARAVTLPELGSLPDRILHGDPKFSNVLFAGPGPQSSLRPVCLVDLDTVGPGPLHLELGDMWRSWCNLRGEDERNAAFDLAVFEASLAGYASACPAPTPTEREALTYGLEWITLELAARFAADALHERYFGWDPARFAARGEHNLVRALGQWSLHGQVVATREERRAAIRCAW